MNQEFSRMLDKETRPNNETILDMIGKTAGEAWTALTQYLGIEYDFKPETVFYGRKYGWTVRYRRSGRTLCSLFPEEGAFTVLIVLGKKEVEKVFGRESKLSESTKTLIRDTKQVRGGRWLWIRILTTDDITDIKHLLHIKKQPKSLK